jgi:hydroxyethylthiazole kinase-like uncharacterized protein yjeF
MRGMSTGSGSLYAAQQVRELDRRAIEVFGIPGYELMTRAGHATLNALRATWPSARSLCVLCGPGNNGGDGYVVARVARAQGLRVNVVAIIDPGTLKGDARKAFEDFTAAGGRWQRFTPEALDADVLVDAMFGTGLAREVEGEPAATIGAVNTARRPVVAVDIPSGLEADTGRVLGVAVRANLTVTFIGRKLGFYLGEGPEQAGRCVFDPLGVPAATYDGVMARAELIDEGVAAAALPRRPRAAHKGLNGHVLVIGGGPGMSGAARLAGEAALRAGAGLVTVATHPSSTGAIAARPELMCVAVEDPGELEAVLERATVLALGPGLGRSQWARGLWAAALARDVPKVVDADALNLLAATPRCDDSWVLTPHPGEAARLLGMPVHEVQSDRLSAVTELQKRYRGTVVLKGAGSLIRSAQGLPGVCGRGNPGMAVAGMGDVLTGLIAGIAAQCGDAALAARAGVFVHAQAGDLAAQHGERGMLASDLLGQLRACVNPA